MKSHPQDIEVPEIFDNAIATGLFVQFRLECAEEFVPDDQDPSIIAIEIVRITGVVDSVVAGGIS